MTVAQNYDWEARLACSFGEPETRFGVAPHLEQRQAWPPAAAGKEFAKGAVPAIEKADIRPDVIQSCREIRRDAADGLKARDEHLLACSENFDNTFPWRTAHEFIDPQRRLDRQLDIVRKLLIARARLLDSLQSVRDQSRRRVDVFAHVLFEIA